jgi:hypothetical protein
MRACRRAAGAGAARLRGMAHTTRVLESGRRCCTLAGCDVCVCVSESLALLHACMAACESAAGTRR